MPDGVKTARAVVGALCLVGCACALRSLCRTAPAVPAAYAEAGPRPVAPVRGSSGRLPSHRQWVVRVDGWSLRFDGVKPSSLPPLGGPPEDGDEAGADSGFASPYDDLIVRHATAAGLDWRFVSAVIYEESRFFPDRESDKGAYGLMQVREIAAREVGAESYHSPDANISAGVRYLRYLDGLFSAASERDRLALMLVGYNMGPAHVEDARILAEHFGFDPLRWDDSIEVVLPLLERPAIYERLPNGYAQGRTTVAYVNRVLDRYARDPRHPGLVPQTFDQASSATG